MSALETIAMHLVLAARALQAGSFEMALGMLLRTLDCIEASGGALEADVLMRASRLCEALAVLAQARLEATS